MTACTGGKKSSRWRDDLWTVKYLPRYKWYMLSEHVGPSLALALIADSTALETSIQTNLLRSHISQSKRDQADYLEQVERARQAAKRESKRSAAATADQADAPAPTKPRKAKKERAFAQRSIVQPKPAASAASSAKLESVLNSLFV